MKHMKDFGCYLKAILQKNKHQTMHQKIPVLKFVTIIQEH